MDRSAGLLGSLPCAWSSLQEAGPLCVLLHGHPPSCRSVCPCTWFADQVTGPGESDRLGRVCLKSQGQILALIIPVCHLVIHLLVPGTARVLWTLCSDPAPCPPQSAMAIFPAASCLQLPGEQGPMSGRYQSLAGCHPPHIKTPRPARPGGRESCLPALGREHSGMGSAEGTHSALRRGLWECQRGALFPRAAGMVLSRFSHGAFVLGVEAGGRGTGKGGEDVCVTARVLGSRLSAPAFLAFVLNFFFFF